MNHIWRSASKEIEALHNVTFFSKLFHGHFSANITKFSEQLSLTPTHVNLDNMLL